MTANQDKGTVKDPKINSKKMTICEMHRQLYKRLKNTKAYTPDVDMLLNMAFDAGKKMAGKLTRHAVEWEDYSIVKEKLSKTTLDQDEEIAWDDPRDGNK
tara:strand:- start:368 stop:667 length:300 start_codon:yes stop_codon:yes gene_type:complete